ncbi:MAG: transcription elongation factor GreA [Coriobacteriia bacterium]|nr:transcription elongation factor GreA [Coriobacteriia bacterium]
MAKIELTASGLQELEAELAELIEVRRPAVVERIAQAKGFGDLSENSEYDDAKNEQGFIESRIVEVESILSHAVVVKPPSNVKTVKIGTTVTFTDTGTRKQQTFDIVASANANPMKGLMSDESPIGAGLLGKKEGDKVELKTPAGIMTVKINKVKATK